MILPKTIARFEVIGRLGSGSFATVWLAHDPDLESRVAIKVLAENWSYNEDATRRFIQEARDLRKLDDERIIRVYEGARLEDGRPYMVMDYADRGNLQDRMSKRLAQGDPFSVVEAVAISADIADCLAAAHALRIVHRDLKPSNVLFKSISPDRIEALRREGKATADERMLLADFGIARRLEGTMSYTMVVGTPHYMAPEQADPLSASSADQRCDIYAAAVILYELLAGRVPFPYESLARVQRAQQEEEPTPIREVRPEVSARLAELLSSGLAPDPNARVASAWEWRRALLDVLAEPKSIAGKATARDEPSGGTATIVDVVGPGPIAPGQAKETAQRRRKRTSERGSQVPPPTTEPVVLDQARPAPRDLTPTARLLGRPRLGWGWPPARLAVMVAVLLIAIVGAGAFIALNNAKPTPAKYNFAAEYDAQDVATRRVWTLSTDGRTLTGTLDFANPSSGASDFVFTEVIPKSLAETANLVSFSLPAPAIVQADPVVRYTLTIPGKSSARASYTIRVPAGASSRERLLAWVNDQTAAVSAFKATARIPSPQPSPQVSATASPTAAPPAPSATTPPAPAPAPAPAPPAPTPPPPPPPTPTPPPPPPVNNPPVANSETYGNMQCGTGKPYYLYVVTVGPGADSDPDGDPLTIVAYTQPYTPAPPIGALPTLTLGGSDFLLLDYPCPISASFGTMTFTYTISDGRGGQSTTTDYLLF